jgi:hypothetical protein
MKMILQAIMAVAAVWLLAGCETTGLSPREHSGVTYPNYILSLPASGTNAPPKPEVPIRLAVVQVGESAPAQAMLDKLAAEPAIIASVVGLPLPGEDSYYNHQNSPKTDYAGRVKTICNLARTTGADYVFLFGGNIDAWQKNNWASVFDITLIGGWLVPGTEIHVEGKSAGVLISTATVEPVLFVNAGATESAIAPDYLADGKVNSVRAKVRDQLVEKLGAEFLRRLAETSGLTKTAN